MIKIYLIHFLPIENYPPLLNLISYLGNNYQRERLTVYTTNTLLPFSYNNNKILIKRLKNPSQLNRFLRFIYYIFFHLKVIASLFINKPLKIIYYETLSSFAPIIYCWLRKWKVDLYIHYHEYTSPEEYKNGMVTSRFFHLLEKKIYNKARWISLTNKMRVKKFMTDNPGIVVQKVHSLPNFPPRTWAKNSFQKEKIEKPVKIVFVGSLSNETMFYEEFANWVLKLNGQVIWDIYSQQISKDVLEHINKNGNGLINFKGFINYNELNKALEQYDSGVILYRGHIDNFIYNATNKLFEYLACGLDVWFSEELIGAYDYITKGTYPKVLKLDFKNLAQYDLDELISHENLTYKPSTYFAEDVYEPFINEYLLQ